jgi:addiction module HigA family antidote
MPRPPIHPGEILADELTELNITPTELSRQLSVPPNRISQIIQGKCGITGDTALRLGHWFQTSAQFWLNLQSAYDLRVATDRIGREVAALPTKAKRREGAERYSPAGGRRQFSSVEFSLPIIGFSSCGDR